MVLYGYYMDHGTTLLIAVDGGGTGCRVRLCDGAGAELASAEGGPANVTTDFDLARANIDAAVRRAYEAAQIEPGHRAQDVAMLGLAGAGIGDYAKQMEQALGFARARVTTDRETTVQGALGEGDGVVALLGTGSFFSARFRGQEHNIGGWGFRLGDEAGGAWLGRELLRRTLHALDGLMAHSQLTRDTSRRFSDRPAELVAFAQDATPAEFGRFAPEIAAAQAAGDTVAELIMDEAVRLICQRLDALGTHATGALYLLGGLATVYRPLLPMRYQELCKPPHGGALDGAVMLAQRDLAAARGAP